MLRTFFRHYSLYEYSFKPKVDIILMTMPENVNQESAKGPSSMAHNSILEASKANDEIGEINLDGSVEKEAAADERSSLNKSKHSKQETGGGEKTPSKMDNASKQESKENLHSG